MKNVVTKLFVTIGLALGLNSFNANAALMSTGYWSDPITGDLATAGTVMGEGTNKISWGRSAGYGQSSWTFKGLDDIDLLTNGDWFKIGKFKHINNPIYKYHFLGADLNLNLSNGGDLFSLSFGVDHWETLNKSNPCPYGTNPCADRVMLPTIASSDTITIDGMVYEMTIKGFTRSDGYTNTIWTDEKGKSYAKIYASLSKVPEPSVIALFGIGLLGLGFASRRKRQG